MPSTLHLCMLCIDVCNLRLPLARESQREYLSTDYADSTDDLWTLIFGLGFCLPFAFCFLPSVL
jgi:hypothetical protein